MKPELQIKQGESLSDWCDRIADYWHFRDELRETLHTISKVSYEQGVDDVCAPTKPAAAEKPESANKKK